MRAAQAKIEAVAMDLSPAYIAAVERHLPQAVIVHDRFHLVRLMNEILTQLRRELHHQATAMPEESAQGKSLVAADES